MEEINIPINTTSSRTYTVTKEDSAINQRSGDVNVLGTPRLLAMMEEVSYKSVAQYLHVGCVSVGFQMNIQHLKPSFVGERITVESFFVKQEGKKLFFAVECKNETEEIVGRGECIRVIVDKNRFENREK